MKRRQILQTSACLLGGLAIAPWLPGIPAARAENGDVHEQDRILGDAGAPVTIIEYSSLTCPHCASFHTGTLPKIKSDWIDTGKARLVYRHFPLDGVALRAAAVANCLEGPRHFTFLDALFKNQQRWSRAEDPIAALGNIYPAASRALPEQAVLDEFDQAVDIAALESTLMAEGTEKFADPQKKLLQTIAEKRSQLAEA